MGRQDLLTALTMTLRLNILTQIFVYSISLPLLTRTNPLHINTNLVDQRCPCLKQAIAMLSLEQQVPQPILLFCRSSPRVPASKVAAALPRRCFCPSLTSAPAPTLAEMNKKSILQTLAINYQHISSRLVQISSAALPYPAIMP